LLCFIGLQNLFLPRFFATFWTAKMARAPHMHRYKYSPESWNMLVATFSAFIVASDLFDF
jgi:hypothetical protein